MILNHDIILNNAWSSGREKHRNNLLANCCNGAMTKHYGKEISVHIYLEVMMPVKTSYSSYSCRWNLEKYFN